jgi:hypothetical protein
MKKYILQSLLIFCAGLLFAWLLLLYFLAPEKDSAGNYLTVKQMHEFVFCGGIGKC